MIDFQCTPLHVDLLGSECISLLSYSACFGSLMAFWTSLSDALWADTTEVSTQCEKRRKERLMTLLSFGASGHGRSLSHEDTAGNRMTTPKAGHANGNVVHHSCALMSSRSSQCCSDVNDTRVRPLKTSIILSAGQLVWYLRFQRLSLWTNDWNRARWRMTTL